MLKKSKHKVKGVKYMWMGGSGLQFNLGPQCKLHKESDICKNAWRRWEAAIRLFGNKTSNKEEHWPNSENRRWLGEESIGGEVWGMREIFIWQGHAGYCMVFGFFWVRWKFASANDFIATT